MKECNVDRQYNKTNNSLLSSHHHEKQPIKNIIN